jgi:hypothetical protein
MDKVKCFHITSHYAETRPLLPNVFYALHVEGEHDNYIIELEQHHYLYVINQIGNPIGKEFYFEWDHMRNQPNVALELDE